MFCSAVFTICSFNSIRVQLLGVSCFGSTILSSDREIRKLLETLLKGSRLGVKYSLEIWKFVQILLSIKYLRPFPKLKGEWYYSAISDWTDGKYSSSNHSATSILVDSTMYRALQIWLGRYLRCLRPGLWLHYRRVRKYRTLRLRCATINGWNIYFLKRERVMKTWTSKIWKVGRSATVRGAT